MCETTEYGSDRDFIEDGRSLQTKVKFTLKVELVCSYSRIPHSTTVPMNVPPRRDDKEDCYINPYRYVMSRIVFILSYSPLFSTSLIHIYSVTL